MRVCMRVCVSNGAKCLQVPSVLWSVCMRVCACVGNGAQCVQVPFVFG